MHIRSIDAGEAESRIDDLVAVIRDSVEHGASVNFLLPVDEGRMRSFWGKAIADVAADAAVLLVADTGERIVATAMLVPAPQQNQPHRADVAKMLVHSDHRRQGIAAALLSALEAEAVARGRTLLLLDTETDSAGERLYESAGWVRFGIVPGHAMRPDATLAPTSFFYKELTAGA